MFFKYKNMFINLDNVSHVVFPEKKHDHAQVVMKNQKIISIEHGTLTEELQDILSCLCGLPNQSLTR